MFTAFCPLIKESKSTLSLFPKSTFIFPSHINNDGRMSGVGIILDWKSSRKFPPYKHEFFDFIEFAKRNIFIFISMNMTFWKPIRILPLKPFVLNQNVIVFFSKYHFSDENWMVRYSKKSSYQRFISDHTQGFSPLKIMVEESSNMSQDEKSFLHILVDKGFPYISLSKIIKKEDTLKKWRKYKKFPAESNVRVVAKRSISAFATENKSIIEKISENLVDPSNYGFPPKYPITDCFLYMQKYLEKEGIILFGKRIPGIYIRKIGCRAIFSINEKDIKKLLMEWNKLFDQMNLGFSVYCSLQRKHSKEGKRTRFSFNILYDFSASPLEIYEIHSKIIIIENLIKHKLKEIDPESYFKFKKKHIKEFWIKSLEINVDIPFRLLKEAETLTRDYFSDSIVSQKGHIFLDMKNLGSGWVKTRFELSFGYKDDFVVKNRHSGFFYDISAKDTLTRIGIEYGFRKNYSKALEFLKKANKAMEADLLVLDSEQMENEQKEEKIEKAKAKYKFAGLDTSNLTNSPLYLKDEYFSKIRSNLERNYDWIVGLQLFILGQHERKEAIELKYMDKDGYDRKLLGAKRYLRLAGIKLCSDIISLEEGLSIYYARLLGFMQEKGPDLAKEWLESAP